MVGARVSGAQQCAHGLHGRSLRSCRWALGTDGLYQKTRLPWSKIKRQSPFIPRSLNCGEPFATRALLPLPKAGPMPPTGDGKAPGSGNLGSRELGANRAHRAPRRRQLDASGGRAGAGARSGARPERGPGGAGPGACARTSHSGARGRPLASQGGRPARAFHPPPSRTPESPAGVCPTGVGPLLSALSGPRRQGLTTGPQPRTAWTRRLSRTRRQSKLLRATGGGAEEAPTAARGRRGRRRSRPLLA